LVRADHAENGGVIDQRFTFCTPFSALAAPATASSMGLYVSQVQRLVVDDVAWVFVGHAPAQQITSSRIHGFVLYPDGINRFGEA
jgi:hypothetical protein